MQVRSTGCCDFLHWSDVALGLHVAGLTEPGGAHLENLVLADLVAWRDTVITRPEVLIWRTVNGEEVDFVVEHGRRLVVAGGVTCLNSQ